MRRGLLLVPLCAASAGCSVLAEGELAELPAGDDQKSGTAGGPSGDGCEAWTDDCNDDPADGCETNLLDSVSDCGGCGHACAMPNAVGLCKGALCVVDACEPGWADCNGEVADGCEVDTSTDAAHCGGCDQACSDANATASCAGGVCTVSCEPSWGDCNLDPADGCETSLVEDDHCGACGNACVADHGTAVCAGGACEIVECVLPWADCDRAFQTGCEANLDTSPATCGSCDVACSSDNGAPACDAGACGIACDPGFSDCDDAADNGCETVLATDGDNCGACGNACLAGRTCLAGACDPPWLTIGAVNAPSMRERAAAAWTGSAMFVWGGQGQAGDLDDGALYDPATDAWTPVAAAGAPSARRLAAAVWTGAHVVVWGGAPDNGPAALGNGKRYAPAADQWTGISNADAPSPRIDPVAVWTGSHVVVWGGADGGGGPAPGGAMYDDGADAWTPISTVGAPSPRSGVAFAWTGVELLIFGGRIGGTMVTSQGHAFDPAKNEWRPLPILGAPSPRWDAFGQMTADGFVVWGGRDPVGDTLADGGVYDPTTDSWQAFPVVAGGPKRAAPARRTGWSACDGDLLLLLGGLDVAPAHDGRSFEPPAAAWLDVPGWPSNVDHEWGASVWTGDELILWGGLNAGALDAAGERYQP